MSISLQTILLACLAFALGKLLVGRTNKYPPGPRPLPILGNVCDAPTIQPWITYSNWAKQYGDLVHISVIGQHICLVNSVKVATDLFEKRSAIYSDRPTITMATLLGWDTSTPLLGYGDRWKIHRRIFHQKYRPEDVISIRPLQFSKAHQLLHGLLTSLDDFVSHVKTYTASIVLYTTYGHQIVKDDPLVKASDEAAEMIFAAVFPGAQIVNTFPILQHLPDWFPGTSFKDYGRKCQRLLEKLKNVPFNVVRESVVSGNFIPSMTSDFLQMNDRAGGDKIDEEIFKEAAVTSFAAGADTTAAALKSFILQMVLNPEVQKRAQEEIDAVVGGDRLPNFDDRPSLPYIEAVFRESLRYRPVTPLGVVRSTSSDDDYEGYFIPKGSMVLSNIWAMTHNERVFERPNDFMPERYFSDDGSLNDDSTILTFGFGRRICAGRHLAEGSIWIAMVSTLAVFNLSKATDAFGQYIDVPGDYTEGVFSFPQPFTCSIKPRSQQAHKLAEAAAIDI